MAGCMFHSQGGLMSFEHPTKKMKAMPRIDSEGVMCGANFKVDVQSRVHTMPRVGSEANCATWGSHAWSKLYILLISVDMKLGNPLIFLF